MAHAERRFYQPGDYVFLFRPSGRDNTKLFRLLRTHDLTLVKPVYTDAGKRIQTEHGEVDVPGGMFPVCIANHPNIYAFRRDIRYQRIQPFTITVVVERLPLAFDKS